MASELPDWAMEKANELRMAAVWQGNAATEIIAGALVEAERAGMEKQREADIEAAEYAVRQGHDVAAAIRADSTGG